MPGSKATFESSVIRLVAIGPGRRHICYNVTVLFADNIFVANGDRMKAGCSGVVQETIPPTTLFRRRTRCDSQKNDTGSRGNTRGSGSELDEKSAECV